MHSIAQVAIGPNRVNVKLNPSLSCGCENNRLDAIPPDYRRRSIRALAFSYVKEYALSGFMNKGRDKYEVAPEYKNVL